MHTNAYQTWHCGNDDCDGAELESFDNSNNSCPSCGSVYDSGDGRLVTADPDGDDEDLSVPAPGVDQLVELWRCERCRSTEWVGYRAGPEHEGWPRKAQCVPCGRIQELPVSQ